MNLDSIAQYAILPPSQVDQSHDGTRKYLFSTTAGPVETVVIPHEKRFTICLSTQCGCCRNCRFCATARMGFHGNLTSADIINQLCSVDEARQITNIVFMGMGEPFDNPDALFSAIDQMIAPKGLGIPPRRITVSTAGVLPGIITYLNQYTGPLAISLHSPFHKERAQLMPIESRWPIQTIAEALRATPFASQRRIFLEYMVIKSLNHSLAHAEAIRDLFQGIKVRINLMRHHALEFDPYQAPDDSTLIQFRNTLNQMGLIATIRQSRGSDIKAACGMLARPNKSPTDLHPDA